MKSFPLIPVSQKEAAAVTARQAFRLCIHDSHWKPSGPHRCDSRTAPRAFICAFIV